MLSAEQHATLKRKLLEKLKSEIGGHMTSFATQHLENRGKPAVTSVKSEGHAELDPMKTRGFEDPEHLTAPPDKGFDPDMHGGYEGEEKGMPSYGEHMGVEMGSHQDQEEPETDEFSAHRAMNSEEPGTTRKSDLPRAKDKKKKPPRW